jgi:putative thiamine transport system ATP-binding protein
MGSMNLVFERFEVRIGGEMIFAFSGEVKAGQCLALMGLSGLGKSTILQAIAGFAPDWAEASGKIAIDGQSIMQRPPEQRRLGLLFQDDLLFPHLTVAGNLLFALPPGGSKSERRAKVQQVLGEAGLAGLEDRHHDQLSGGQRSRVALLRTLLSGPKALLLDEPFARLDAASKSQMQAMVRQEAQRRALPMLLVTHDRADAEALDATIITLPHRNE